MWPIVARLAAYNGSVRRLGDWGPFLFFLLLLWLANLRSSDSFGFRPTPEELEEQIESADIKVRIGAIRSVTWRGADRPEYLRVIDRGLQDEDPLVQAWAAAAFCQHHDDRIDDDIIARLADGLSLERKPFEFALWLRRLGKRASPAADALADRAREGDDVGVICVHALFLIEGPTPRVLAVFRGALAGEEAISALISIQQLGPAIGILVPEIKRLIPHRNYLSMRKAIDALNAVTGSTSDALTLLRATLASPDAELRENGAWGIARIGEPAADLVPALVTLSGDSSAEVRVAVAHALRKAAPGSPVVRETLVALGRDDDRYVREAAADQLRSLGG